MKIERAYSVLTVKSISEEGDQRIIEGIATTPNPDRVGDIVEPKGAQFKMPLPLLWQHNSNRPIGHVLSAKVTNAGISIKARIAKIDEPGILKDRLDEAWQSLKSGLVAGLSIGFKSLEHARISEDSYAVRFLKWEWLELSAVTIPANADAGIQSIKAAFGHQSSAGVSAPRSKLLPKEGTMKTIREQLAELEEARTQKAARMSDIMQVASDESRNTSPEEAQEFDILRSEVEKLDDDIRSKSVELYSSNAARPVDQQRSAAAASASRGGNDVTVRDNKEKGMAFAQFAKCLGRAKGDLMVAERIAKTDKGIDPRIARIISKAVEAGSTASGNWATNLVGDETAVFADFIEYLRPTTILGKFGQAGVPALRRVPFRVPLVGQTEGGDGYWVGEGKAKPLTKFDFGRTTLEPLKVANIAVVTQELLRASSPAADMILRDSLAAALRERMDTDFIDPTKTASAGVSPASVTNGVGAGNASGTDADAVRADLKTLFGTFIAANNAPTSGVWIMTSSTALALSLMVNALGQPEFPGITMNGGMLAGLPVITSEYVPTVSAGSYLILVNASDIYLGDEGEIMIDVSREASLEMSEAPSHNSTTPTAAQMVSMFQTNSVAFRAEMTINWARRRTSAVSYLAAVNYA